MLKIKGTPDLEGIKRCYVNGAVAELKCPNCGATVSIDFGEQYLSYPEIGEQTEAYFGCDCNDSIEYSVPVRVVRAEVEIEIDTDKVQEY